MTTFSSSPRAPALPVLNGASPNSRGSLGRGTAAASTRPNPTATLTALSSMINGVHAIRGREELARDFDQRLEGVIIELESLIHDLLHDDGSVTPFPSRRPSSEVATSDHTHPEEAWPRPPTSLRAPAGGESPTQASQQIYALGDNSKELATVVAMAHQSVDGCDLASGVIVCDGTTTAAEASAPLAAKLGRIQRELGEGPGLHAGADSPIVTSEDVGADSRWPAFGACARQLGISGAMSLALIPRREYPRWYGRIDLYSHDAGQFGPASITLGRTLALYCSSMVNSSLHARSLEAALVSRDVIGQAKGILMARRTIDEEQAFEILRHASQRTNRPLRDVAATVIRSSAPITDAAPAVDSV